MCIVPNFSCFLIIIGLSVILHTFIKIYAVLLSFIMVLIELASRYSFDVGLHVKIDNRNLASDLQQKRSGMFIALTLPGESDVASGHNG